LPSNQTLIGAHPDFTRISCSSWWEKSSHVTKYHFDFVRHALDKNRGDLCDLSIKGVFVHTMMQDSWQFFVEDAGKGTTFALET